MIWPISANRQTVTGITLSCITIPATAILSGADKTAIRGNIYHEVFVKRPQAGTTHHHNIHIANCSLPAINDPDNCTGHHNDDLPESRYKDTNDFRAAAPESLYYFSHSDSPPLQSDIQGKLPVSRRHIITLATASNSQHFHTGKHRNTTRQRYLTDTSFQN